MAKKTTWILLLLLGGTLFSASLAMAAEEGLSPDVKKIVALASGLAIAIAALGGALGQGIATAKGLEGIARNPEAQPKIFIPMIIGLALIESLVIYALVISILLFGKL